ncbi:MAG: TVP38/TMEM64 family protein [Alphaproteobacteria bacterium]|jgi:uncharacterized membrane protein YdjX (TVP38/TMEM64 family)|nr:TVP38/TMEM64 family protein [Alphaproteobacteria bacterium]
MSVFPRFLRRLDASPARAVWVSALLFALVIAIFVTGRTGAIVDVEALRASMDRLADGPWGLPALIAVFCVCAFVGVPQFVLIGLSVFAFGPLTGFAFAWVATMVSGALNFWIGRLVGEDAVRRHGGQFVNRLSAFIGRNAVAASAIVRNVPTGPFLLVNMVFGVSHARFTHYLAGMGIGILPKIALVAFAGTSIMSAFEGQPLLASGAALLALAIWLALVLYARGRLRAERQDLPETGPVEIDTAAETRN